MSKETKKYKVVEPFELEPAVEAKEAVTAEVGSEVDLTETRAAELGAKVELVS